MDAVPRPTSLPSSEPAAALVALHEVAGAIARQTDPHTTLKIIAEKARVLTRAASAAVSLLNPARTLLDFAGGCWDRCRTDCRSNRPRRGCFGRTHGSHRRSYI